ncbi:MAG: hypothetical protein ABEN55_11405 [Bradymonadaceae bacterium]
MSIRAFGQLLGITFVACLSIACETPENDASESADQAEAERDEEQNQKQASESGGARPGDKGEQARGGPPSGEGSRPEFEAAEADRFEDLQYTTFEYVKSLDAADRELPAVSEGGIDKEQYAPGAGNLPQGLEYIEGGIRVEPGYPTEDEPHLYLGRVIYDTSAGGDHFTHEILELFRKEVGRRGGNLMIWGANSDSDEPPYAHVVRLSDAEAEADVTDPEKLLAEEAEAPKSEGYDELVASGTRSLNPFEPFEFEARRGKCYWVTFALGPDASFDDPARELLKHDLQHPSDIIDNDAGHPEIDETDADGNLTAAARSGHDKIPCPQTTGTLEYQLKTIRASGGKRQEVPEIGEGEIELRVYATDISEEKLAQQKREYEKAREKARKEAEENRKEVCKKCLKKKRKCVGDPADCEEYEICVERRGLTVDYCIEQGY